MTNAPHIDTELAELEREILASSAAFEKEVAHLHGELNKEFAATDAALEDFVKEIERDDLLTGNTET